MEDKSDLTFIKNFTKVKVADACRYFGYNQSNLIRGKCGRLAERNVRNYIEIKLAEARITASSEIIGEIECKEK